MFVPDIREDYTHSDVAELVYFANQVVADHVAHNRLVEGTDQNTIIWKSLTDLRTRLEDFKPDPDQDLLREVTLFRCMNDNTEATNRTLVDLIRQASQTTASTTGDDPF